MCTQRGEKPGALEKSFCPLPYSNHHPSLRYHDLPSKLCATRKENFKKKFPSLPQNASVCSLCNQSSSPDLILAFLSQAEPHFSGTLHSMPKPSPPARQPGHFPPPVLPSSCFLFDSTSEPTSLSLSRLSCTEHAGLSSSVSLTASGLY